ncbi:hypothetical protein EsH8_IX_000759 [Colletotrichum jinshuiense]
MPQHFHPPPPPPGDRPPINAIFLYPPPPPPPPPPSDTYLEGRGLTKAPIQRSLSPSMSFSSGSWQQEYTSSGSEASSDEADYFEQKNRVVFPPLMPTVQARKVVERERKLVTDVITNKVSRFENSRGSVPSLVESDASSVASVMSSDDDGVQDLWVQMKERRQRLHTIKQEMASRRKAFRELRRKKDEADNTFMNLLRPILIRGRQGLLGTSEEMLEKRFTEMQTLRTEYHWLESGYEGLEFTLDEEEEDLNNIETRFFSLLAAGSTKALRTTAHMEAPEDDEQDDQSKMPYELTGISRNGPPDDSHPLWQDLMSAIGDLNNAQEEFDDLLLYREQYAYGIEIKQIAGKEPSAEELEFMEEFPEEQREKQEKVNRLTEEVGRLKEICKEKGAMKKHPSFRIAYALDPNIGEDFSLDGSPPKSGTLAHIQFPQLLSQPDHVLRPEPLTALEELRRAARLPANDPTKNARLFPAQKEFGISRLVSEFKGGDKSDFITRWLLHQLRTSPLAVELLYSTFIQTMHLKIDDKQRWQQDVLFHWWRDDAVKPPEEFFGPLTGSGMVSPGHESLSGHISLPPERAVRHSASSRAATEDWSSGRRQVFHEEAGQSTAVC